MVNLGRVGEWSREIDFTFKLSPEERLLVAIADRAIRDLLNVDNSKLLKPEDVRSARVYFIDTRVEVHGTFAHFCEHFDLDRRELIRKVLEGDEDLIDLFRQTRSKISRKKWLRKAERTYRQQRQE
jgi:hypothetical protein